MTTMTVNFVVPQCASPVPNGPGRTMLRLGRSLAGALRASLNLAPQDRADKYVARTPIAVLAA